VPRTLPVRWGIIGPGGIAKSFLYGLNSTDTGTLVAVGSRNPDKPSLTADFPGARIHNGYQALLDDPEVEAVYVATPHPFHAEWAIKAAEAGKHALVEKPMGLTAFQAEAMFDAARKHGTFMGEAFMYRHHPHTQIVVDLVKSGIVGEVRMIKSNFGFALPKFMPEHRLFANDLAGGGIIDIGGYPVSMSRLIAGAAAGTSFLDPVTTLGVAHLGKQGTDEWAAAVLKFENEIIAEVSCSIMLKQDNLLRIVGTEGRIEVRDFLFASGEPGGMTTETGTFHVLLNSGETRTYGGKKGKPLYAYEIDSTAAAVRNGRREFDPPGMTWADTIGNLRTLDKWRADVGLEYNIEKAPRRGAVTIRGDKLKAPKTGGVAARQITGLSQPTSVVAMGFEHFPRFAGAAMLLDHFYEHGGNIFDTAWVYGAGRTEKFFGDWARSRGVKRSSYVLIGKGAHSPLCYPDQIGKQLAQSLDRMETDYVDIYFIHRDNPDVPVDEFVDAVNVEMRAGRIKDLFGGSNWMRQRMDAAIRYANKKSFRAPGALYNNFGLSEMVWPMWDGCVGAGDDTYNAWLKRRKIPNFLGSSQGGGFVTDAAGRDKFDSQEIVNSWYSPHNFKRRDRAIELSKQLGVSPIQIALAYVLNQPLEMIPIIEPRSLSELVNSLEAATITLTKDQLKWLEA
jgi:predicted dehydrogenase/aryl-alcohol dehydrogenase-like predicted oxidoreductase